MSLLNRALTAVFDLLLRPLQLMSPLVGVSLLSLATAVIVLLVMKASSDQRRIRAARRGMYAAILEMRLFNDDLRAILRAQMALLTSNAAYLRASLVPVLWLVVPLGLLIAQLDLYYGYAAVAPGESVLVTARLRDGADRARAPVATLASPPGMQVEIPGIWFPAAHEVVWNLAPQSAGEYGLRMRIGSEEIFKTLRVSNLVVRTSPARTAPGWVDQLRHPAERPLPGDSAVEAILVSYPTRDLDVLGWTCHWLVFYGVLSFLLVLALAHVFRIAV